jgi:O-antigen ligase
MSVPVALYLNQLRITNPEGLNEVNYELRIIETFLGVVLPIVFTVLAGARVGMVIAPVLLGLAYVFYCKFKPLLKWGLVIAGIIASGFILQAYIKNDNRFADPIRVDLRKTAISAIKEKPVFGWGTGSAKSLIHSEERSHDSGIETVYDFNQFHNQYLEDMVQFGIAGILILLVLFGWILWIGVSEKNYLLLSLLIIYGLCCYTETPLFGSKGVIPFTFWLCFLMSNRNLLTQNKIT